MASRFLLAPDDSGGASSRGQKGADAAADAGDASGAASPTGSLPRQTAMDAFRTGAQYVIKSRRALRALQGKLDSTAENVASGYSQAVAASGEALAAADQRLSLSRRAGEVAAAADQAARDKLGISAESRSVQALEGFRGRMAALSRELSEDLSELGQKAQGLRAHGERGSQRMWSEVNKRVMATASNFAAPRELISAIDPEALCFFDAGLLPGARRRVALTIDDAPCHVPEADRCMMDEVRLLLEEHGARATFFLCTDYVAGHEASLEALLRAGHEVANHAGADRPYGGDSEDQFEAQLLASEAICEELRRSAGLVGANAPAASASSSSPPASAGCSSPFAPSAPGDNLPAPPAGSGSPSASAGCELPPAPRAPSDAAGRSPPASPRAPGDDLPAASASSSSPPASTGCSSSSSSPRQLQLPHQLQLQRAPGDDLPAASASSSCPASSSSPPAPRAPRDDVSAAPAGPPTCAGPPAAASAGSSSAPGAVADCGGVEQTASAASAGSSSPSAPGAATDPAGARQQACADPPAARSASSGLPSALDAGRAAASASVVLPSQPLRWFRAPHADVSDEMRRVLRRHGFTNVLCDCFASDTTIIDPRFIASTLLSQVDRAGDGGSILVIHAPERGFREHNLEALRLLLAGLKERGLSVVTVSDLTKAVLAGGTVPAEA